ncbi:hypothetical protein [Yoonia sp.]|uniref:hypothetical protein n=1 Tax=Yoonia sp. TaxID=2212373 RepID=UPI0025E47F2B|nr:hypothetical protein [Yoonia sp.]
MRIVAAFLCFFVIAGPAVSGAWSREKGQWFVASGGNFLLSDGAELPVNYDPTFYAEYGLTQLVTIGLDYHTADRGRINTGLVFASFPLGDTTGRDRFAANLAFGARADPLHPAEKLLRGGLSWGRGLNTGWLAVDATATFGTNDAIFRPKVDMTWGYNISDRWTASVQLQTGQGFDNDYYAKINPAISFGFNDRYRLSVGAIKALTGDEGGALKIDLWTTY